MVSPRAGPTAHAPPWRRSGARCREAARLSPFQRTPLDVIVGRWTLDYSPAFVAMDLMSRVFSPYELNPGGANPLRDILAETVDFDRAGTRAGQAVRHRHQCPHRSRPRVSQRCDHAGRAASLGLPSRPCSRPSRSTARAIGTAATPAIPRLPRLVRECTSKDTILVQINPVERPGTPRTARDILNRLNEVSFNSVLLKELRMIALLRKVANPGDSEGALWAGMRVHRVTSDVLVELGYSSKLNAEWDFLRMLRDDGPLLC